MKAKVPHRKHGDAEYSVEGDGTSLPGPHLCPLGWLEGNVALTFLIHHPKAEPGKPKFLIPLMPAPGIPGLTLWVGAGSLRLSLCYFLYQTEVIGQ